ncbi:MAG: glycine cleavage system protein R [Opitutus sp.]|nr:glycine cleavage system protein R [Opitutus sp.]
MNQSLVMTIIALDRPGIVERVSACVADHGGNWLESRMCRLAGRFVGLARVEVPAGRVAELLHALQGLEADGLRVVLESGVSEAGPSGATFQLELVGQDRPGILRAVTGVLAAHGVNVEELSSDCVSAPMGGGNLFQARARVVVPTGVKLEEVRAGLEKIAHDLMVDLRLQPARAEAHR